MQAHLVRSLVVSATLFAVIANTVIAVPVSDNTRDDVPYRLPNNTRPITYDIKLTTAVDRGELGFTGHVTIALEVLNTSNHIVIHARQLQIDSVVLQTAFLEPTYYDVTYTHDEVTEFLTITSATPLEHGNYQLLIDYHGELRKDNAGFYLSTYTDESGKTVNLATTQFESTDARHAFPCYDEPAKKAVFRVSITHGSNYTAISNMPVIKGPIINQDGTATTEFQQTKLMSTYLLAFIVSDFESSMMIRRGNIPHRVFSRPSSKNEQSYALDASVRILDAIEDYLNVSYTLPKMDNVAVPDFAAGAMENWGLVTYREEYLLYNEKESTTATENSIATIIAHEFGHQWFGNLVSPYWWTFTWLNEGFASIFAYIGTDQVYSEWDIWQYFHVGEYQRALLADGKQDPRPMTHYIEAPKDISAVFDSVVYSKAASVLIMIQHAISEQIFKASLTDYLNKMEYDSAVEDDLFSSFEKVMEAWGNEHANHVFPWFKSWSNQGGYPLITVTRNYETGTFEISQEPFVGSEKAPDSDRRSWWVPFNFATAKNPHYKITEMFDYLIPGQQKKEVKPTTELTWEKGDWIVLNKRATGYYRVNYDEENWKMLTMSLINNSQTIHVHNRAQLLDDAYRLGLAKRLKLSTILNLSVYLKKENEYAPWMTANSFLSTINSYLNGDSEYDLFQFYVGKIVENFYQEVGVTEKSDDMHLRKMARSIAVNWACRANYGDCLEVTNSRLRDFIQTGKTIEPNMRTSIFCNGLTNAGQTEYNFMMKLLMDSKDQAFRRALMTSAIGCMKDTNLLGLYLQTSIQYDSSVNYREQERLNVVPGVADKGPIQLAAAIDFLINNHQKYNELASDWSQNNPLVLAIRSIASRIVTEEQEAHFEKLLSALNNYSDIKQTDFAAARSTVKGNLEWIRTYRQDLIDWLKKFKDTDGEIEGSGGGDGGGDGAASIAVSTALVSFLTFVSLRALF